MPASLSCETRIGACVVSTEIVPVSPVVGAIVTALAVTLERSMLAAPAGSVNVTSTKPRSFSVARPSLPPVLRARERRGQLLDGEAGAARQVQDAVRV